MTTTLPQRRRSVKRDDDLPAGNVGGQVFHLLVPTTAPPLASLPPELPRDWRARDQLLATTPRMDAQWGAAVGIAISKTASMLWSVESDHPRLARAAQQLLLNADAPSGWTLYIAKQVRDYVTTNNGCFTEIVRERRAYGSRVVGINHLSSLRCTRTGDPERPVIYTTRTGREVLLNWWDVLTMVDMPEADDVSGLGLGLCAAERAYQQIRKLSALEAYVYEKVAGSRPLAIYIVSGLTSKQLEQTLRSGVQANVQRGAVHYMGALIAASVQPDAPPGLVTIPLAELPDGFQAVEERERADLIYALAIGLDPQDLRPIGNQQMGAGAQSVVLHEKAKGRGLSMLHAQLVHNLNQLVLSNKTKFYFSERDLADSEREARVRRINAEAVAALVGGPVITAQQGQQILADLKVIPTELVPQDITPRVTITDIDQPALDLQTAPAAGVDVPTPEPSMPARPAATRRLKDLARAARRRSYSSNVAGGAQHDPSLAPDIEGVLRSGGG